MVVQELIWEVPAACSDPRATRHVAVHQECDVLREELLLARLFDARPHGLHDLGNALVHLAERLVPLRLIVLDEVASLPESVARLPEWFWLQPQLRLDDRARDETPIYQLPAKGAPHVDNAAVRAIEFPQKRRREVEIVDLAILHVAHALVVPDGEREERAHHAAAINDVVVKK